MWARSTEVQMFGPCIFEDREGVGKKKQCSPARSRPAVTPAQNRRAPTLCTAGRYQSQITSKEVIQKNKLGSFEWNTWYYGYVDF